MLNYDEFIERVNEAGFCTPFANYIGSDADEQSYSGDPDTDPRVWRTRATQEKKLACGYYFNGKPGYVAPYYASIFVDAFRPRMTMEERYESGKLNHCEWLIWTILIGARRPLGWHEIWQYAGIKTKDERRLLEAALKRLQMSFDVTISGEIDMTSKTGEVYAQCIGYELFDTWVPAEWMKMNPRMEHKEALEIIFRQAEKISNFGEAQKAFRQSLKIHECFA